MFRNVVGFAVGSNLLDRPVKVALKQPVMHDAVFLEFTFGLRAGDSGSDFALVPQNLPLGRLDEPVQTRFSIPHRHRDLPRPHFHGQVRLLRKQPLQLRRLVFSPVVLGDDPIESLDLPAGRILTRGQAHIVSTGVGTVANSSAPV